MGFEVEVGNICPFVPENGSVCRLRIVPGCKTSRQKAQGSKK